VKDPLRHLAAELGELGKSGLLRSADAPTPAGAICLCSNDYLGFAAEPPELGSPSAPVAGGAGASRLISGDHREHRALEETLASWLGQPAALLFSSGYAANVGTLAALAGPGDVIVSDALNHASIIDGCRLSRAEVVVTPHLDTDAVARALAGAARARRRLVVTDSYFSMDGDSPDLGGLRALCDAHDAALYVDEAHALGVFGDEGRGLCYQAGVRPDVLVGTLSKAIGLQGAFVAGSADLRSWLWNRARSMVFSTGSSPWLARAARERLALVRGADDRRARLAELVARTRQRLAARGAPIAPSHGPIVPWLTGDAASALGLSEALLERGVWVRPIRPPTVPRGTARLRITLHAKLTDAQLEAALSALERHLG
jgi:8-amino-7-oxononanoate synthase